MDSFSSWGHPSSSSSLGSLWSAGCQGGKSKSILTFVPLEGLNRSPRVPQTEGIGTWACLTLKTDFSASGAQSMLGAAQSSCIVTGQLPDKGTQLTSSPLPLRGSSKSVLGLRHQVAQTGFKQQKYTYSSISGAQMSEVEVLTGLGPWECSGGGGFLLSGTPVLHMGLALLFPLSSQHLLLVRVSSQ